MALVAALPADLGAAAAVIVRLPLAGLSAEITDLGTDPAYLGRKGRLTTHELDSGSADTRAVRRESNAVSQSIRFELQMAFLGAILTRPRAVDTRVDTRIKQIVGDHRMTSRLKFPAQFPAR
jgi:hypothetical protein